MNLQNAQILIERIRRCEHREGAAQPKNSRSFNMCNIFFDCGSPSCVAGHCADLLGRPGGQDAIVEFLGVSKCTAKQILLGGFSSRRFMHDITVEETVAYLEKLMREETA